MKLSYHLVGLLAFGVGFNCVAAAHELPSMGEIGQFNVDERMRTLFTNPSNVKPLQKVSFAIKESVAQITPACPTLHTGNLYTLTNSQAGNINCYHFEITERSKTTAILVDQVGATNVDLSILRHNNDDTYTLLGSSKNPGNQDESVVILTEPGHYYWYIEVVESDGTPFNFGAAVATELDANEFNDTVASSTILPDRQNNIVGNMDSITDIDYFQFTAVRGQDLSLKLESTNINEYIFEIYNNGWMPIDKGKYIPVTGLQENQPINIRVRANTAISANPSNTYSLQVASIITSFSNHVVSGENGVIRIPYSAFSNPYLTTQAYHKLNWSLVLQDSTGAPVQGATATLKFVKDWYNPVDSMVGHQQTSNSDGIISGLVDLNLCDENEARVRHVDYSMGYKNTWESQFERGAWRIEIPTNVDLNDDEEVDLIGVGGDNFPWVHFAHICYQRLVSSTPS
ncbi:hypothetical protein [Pseudoalteromonas sp. NC201]|uniref:hypothetical protein n=1 Tax=Pseudoalteromonas sp. NC201 TaxID=1514074 RepID=UPI000C7C7307|nr:hypothetical protein [Pseudoalteromonas sp. NC201]AUJ69221.1 hypothetical protein PNC201_04515 [Pseudoalteromonas sp. NC201]